MPEPLSMKDKMRLNHERHWWRYQGAKDGSLLHLFGETPTTYYARLNALLDHPGALVYDPVTVRRLQRLREQRAEARSWKRVG